MNRISGTYTHWIEYLLLLNEKPNNRERMIDFLFMEFASNPKEFQLLLRVLREYIAHTDTKKKQAKKLARQCLAVVSPLVERLGMYREKEELDVTCMRVVDAKRHKAVERIMERYEKDSKRVIDSVLRILTEVVKNVGFDSAVYGRFKRLYSILRKMDTKRYGHPLALYDIFAFRIIVNDTDPQSCFNVLNVLHDSFTPIASRFKDYVTIPKINGYQSIHTCLTNVIPDLDLPFEVQIRTAMMHDIAQEGMAAHWMYTLMRKSLPKAASSEFALVHHYTSVLQTSLEQGRDAVYFFTPKGDLLFIPSGSSALDAAFCIHSSLATHAKKIRINGKEALFSHSMKHGDCIEIIPDASIQVSKDWLQFSTNPTTLKKLYAALRS